MPNTFKLTNFPIDSENFDLITMGSGFVIIKDKKVLLVRESADSLYSFPGGAVEDSESIAETAIRELKEELNLTADIGSKPYIYSFVRYKDDFTRELVLLFHFLPRNIRGKFKPGSDAKQYIWKEKNDDFSDCYENVQDVFQYFLKR